jgi:hypothetical protein
MTQNEKIDAIYEWVVGNPLKEIDGANAKLKDHEKRIEDLEKNKANKFSLSKLFAFAKTIKTGV